MKEFYLKVLMLLIIATMGISQLPAQESLSGLEQKAFNIVQAAYDYLQNNPHDREGFQKAVQYDERFIDHENELYIFMHVYSVERKEAICWAHGMRQELIDKNMWALRTPTGRMLFIEFIDMIEKQGQGWFEYDWLNPYTDRVQAKMSFLKGITLVDGSQAWIGCGFWKTE